MTLHVVALDGPVGSGKSTVARLLADQLGWSFLDTGAMYRAVTVEALRKELPLTNDELGTLAETVMIETLPRVTVDGRNIEDELRTTAVNDAVSIVAAQPRVRAAMVVQQRAFAARQERGTVVEGRDIATVVFPDAQLKVFLTASLTERARRRSEEGAHSVQRRDELDSSRLDSPLQQAPDARIIDTTGRTVPDVVKEILECLTLSN